jgi:hypothetical protein
MTAEGWVVGLHLWSTHFGACYPMPDGCRQYETATRGIYWRAPGGFTVGGYRNSYGKDSTYAGWTFETADKRFALTVAGVTGYRRAAILPMLAPSIRFVVFDSWAIRASGAPKLGGSANVLHLAIEREL